MSWPTSFGSWVFVVLVSFSVLGVLWTLIRSRRSYRQPISQRVEAAGLTLIRVRVPRFWQTGPFPKIQFRVTPTQTRIGPVSGEFFAYRKLVVADGRGHEHDVWCCLSFTAFRLDGIEFRPPLVEFSSN
ncbi:MAG: hypothetical protein AAF593_00805 [Planctomycetota bacterium]